MTVAERSSLDIKDISYLTVSTHGMCLVAGTSVYLSPNLMMADMKVKANLILVFASDVVFAVGSD